LSDGDRQVLLVLARNRCADPFGVCPPMRAKRTPRAGNKRVYYAVKYLLLGHPCDVPGDRVPPLPLMGAKRISHPPATFADDPLPDIARVHNNLPLGRPAPSKPPG